MHPLIYTTPISKADYLGGRFLAAFVLNALILLAVPLGMLVALLLAWRGTRDHWSVSSGRHTSAPTVFLRCRPPSSFTAVQFSLAALTGRSRRQLPRHCAVLRHGLRHRWRRDQRSSNADPRQRCWIPQSASFLASSGDMDTARDEYRPGRTGELDARESTPLGRRRSGHTRIHLSPLSLRQRGCNQVETRVRRGIDAQQGE